MTGRSLLYLETLNEALPRIGSVLVVQEGQVPPLPLLNLRDAQPVTAAQPAREREPIPQPQAQAQAPKSDC